MRHIHRYFENRNRKWSILAIISSILTKIRVILCDHCHGAEHSKENVFNYMVSDHGTSCTRDHSKWSLVEQKVLSGSQYGILKEKLLHKLFLFLLKRLRLVLICLIWIHILGRIKSSVTASQYGIKRPQLSPV